MPSFLHLLSSVCLCTSCLKLFFPKYLALFFHLLINLSEERQLTDVWYLFTYFHIYLFTFPSQRILRYQEKISIIFVNHNFWPRSSLFHHIKLKSSRRVQLGLHQAAFMTIQDFYPEYDLDLSQNATPSSFSQPYSHKTFRKICSLLLE